jgi:hypothetical protein
VLLLQKASQAKYMKLQNLESGGDSFHLVSLPRPVANFKFKKGA